MADTDDTKQKSKLSRELQEFTLELVIAGVGVYEAPRLLHMLFRAAFEQRGMGAVEQLATYISATNPTIAGQVRIAREKMLAQDRLKNAAGKK